MPRKGRAKDVRKREKVAVETEEMLAQHQALLELYGTEQPREQDSFSLAQPSPFKFVPSVASDQTGCESRVKTR